MPNIYYSSKPDMLLYPHLMAKHCPEVGRKSRFFPDLRHETRQHGAVKVWWRALQSCWECSSLCYTPIQCQTSTILASLHAAICPLDGQTLPEELAENRNFFLDLRHETCQHGAVKVWWRALESCWECSSLSYTSIPMPNIYYSSNLTCCYIDHLMAKHCPRSWLEIDIFSWSEAWNPPTWGCKSMVEGLTIMLGVFTDLVIHLYQCQTSTIQQPTCCYTPLDGQTLPESWLEIEIFSWSEAWNPPTWGCKSMVEGLTIMLGVLLTLLYIYTNAKHLLFNNLHAAIPPLDGQTLPESWLEIEIFSWSEAWNPPTWGCKSMVEGLTIMLGVLLTLLYIYTNAKHLLFNNLHAAIPHLMAKHCLRVGWKSIFFPDLRHETRQHGAVKVWWRDLQSCWECYWPCYTSIPMPNIYYSTTYMLLYPTWWPNIAWELAGNRDFFLIWGMKPANMGL